jgi:transcriptional regulator with XRE-family HTH domain
LSDLAEKLKYFRKQSHLTQQQVADALSIKRSTYAYYETGKTTPKLSTLQSLSRLFNTNVDVLLDNIVSVEEGVISSPDMFKNWYTDEHMSQLSEFEQSILLRVRLLNGDDKKKLVEFLDGFFVDE